MNSAHTSSTPSGEQSLEGSRSKAQKFWRGFWLAFLVASLAYAWYSFYVPSNDIAWADDFAIAQEQSAESGKPVVLFFTGAWCVPCRIMKREVWADDEVTDIVNGGFIPVLIDVGDSDAAATVSQFQVGITPTTIITDAQGNALRWETGGMSKASFLDLLEGRS